MGKDINSIVMLYSNEHDTGDDNVEVLRKNNKIVAVVRDAFDDLMDIKLNIYDFVFCNLH